MNPATKFLIVVHPGSACGSADYTLGKLDARAARDALVFELDAFKGNVIVIDGSFSDELDYFPALQTAIDNALGCAAANGLHALRLWGCDNGVGPFQDWKHLGAHEKSVFRDQEEAARALASVLPPNSDITVTGAWASKTGRTGCVNSVAAVIIDERPELRTHVSEHAVFEPEEPEPEQSPELLRAPALMMH